jgi:AcrR family transcriptional regulator
VPRIKLDPRKAPRQARSQATVALILEAAVRVLGRESLEGFNTNRVAEVAGVSVGSLYQYFPNKAALVAALIDRDHEALAQALEALVGRGPAGRLRDTLAAVARVLIEQQYGDPLYAAAIDHEERRLPMDARTRGAEARFAAVAQTLLARHRREISRTLPASAPQDLLAIAKAVVEVDSLRGRSPPPDLEARIVRALLGYLTVDG